MIVELICDAKYHVAVIHVGSHYCLVGAGVWKARDGCPHSSCKKEREISNAFRRFDLVRNIWTSLVMCSDPWVWYS